MAATKKRTHARSRTIPNKTRARIIELARAGRSANSIAKECGVSASSVSRICKTAEPPITFDRARTKAATEAKTADDRARRVAIASGLLDDVEAVRGQLFAVRDRVYFDPKSGMTIDYAAPLTPGEFRDMAVGLGVLLDKHLAVIKTDSDDREMSAVDKFISWALGEE